MAKKILAGEETYAVNSVSKAFALAVVELLTITFIFLSFALLLIFIFILQYFLRHRFLKIL